MTVQTSKTTDDPLEMLEQELGSFAYLTHLYLQYLQWFKFYNTDTRIKNVHFSRIQTRIVGNKVGMRIENLYPRAGVVN